jgi:hypothetical protein
VANGAFLNLFADCSVENIIATSSDRYVVLISLASGEPRLEKPLVQHGFKYEAAWRRADDYVG